MDTKNICRLCLVSQNKIIEFFGDEGIKLNIAKKLVQHFWFQVFELFIFFKLHNCFYLYSQSRVYIVFN